MTMTREDKLYSMTGAMLIDVAEKLGVKLNKKGNSLKESKEKAIKKILAAEAANVEAEETKEPAPVEVEQEPAAEIAGAFVTPETEPEEKKERKPRAKKAQSTDVQGMLTYIENMWQTMGGNIREPKKDGNFKALCAENGRQVLKLMWTTKKVSLFARIEAAVDFAEKWQKINYALPFQCMFYTDTEETRQNIQNLMEMVMDADAVRITKKMMKEQEKAKKTA